MSITLFKDKSFSGASHPDVNAKNDLNTILQKHRKLNQNPNPNVNEAQETNATENNTPSFRR